MQGAAFDRFLDEAGMTQFLTLRVRHARQRRTDRRRLPGPHELTQADTARFDAAVQAEPIELMKFIVLRRPPMDRYRPGQLYGRQRRAGALPRRTVQGAFTNPADDSEWRQRRSLAQIGECASTPACCRRTPG